MIKSLHTLEEGFGHEQETVRRAIAGPVAFVLAAGGLFGRDSRRAAAVLLGAAG